MRGIFWVAIVRLSQGGILAYRYSLQYWWWVQEEAKRHLTVTGDLVLRDYTGPPLAETYYIKILTWKIKGSSYSVPEELLQQLQVLGYCQKPLVFSGKLCNRFGRCTLAITSGLGAQASGLSAHV